MSSTPLDGATSTLGRSAWLPTGPLDAPGPGGAWPPVSPPARPSRWALVGAGSLGLVLGVALTVGAGWALATSGPGVIAYGPAEALAEVGLQQGQCGRGAFGGAGSLGPEEVVSCDERHDVEAYASLDVPIREGGARPSDDDLAVLADDLCWATFAPYTGESWEDSPLDYVPVVPGERAWAAGARTVHCLLVPFE